MRSTVAVVWKNGVAYDTNCPPGCVPPNCRKAIRYTSGGVPVWSMSSSSGFAARPITDPNRIPCGQRQVNVRVTSVGRAVGDLPKVAAIAVGAVTIAALGQAALAKGAGILGKAAGGASRAVGAAGAANAAQVAQAAAKTSGLFATIQANGNKILNYVNQGRTIAAIANGKIPPPPISIEGASFTEWAMLVAKDEMLKVHKRKMTEIEENALRLEIENMQRAMAKQVPENFPKRPNPQIPAPVQAASAKIQVQAKDENDKMLLILAAIAVPIVFALATR